MTRSGDTVGTPPDEAVLANLFSAVAVSADAGSVVSAPAPQTLFPEGKVNEGGGGVAFAVPSQDGDTLFSVLCIETSEEAQSFCGGFIGGDTSRFCTKLAASTKQNIVVPLSSIDQIHSPFSLNAIRSSRMVLVLSLLQRRISPP